MDHYNELIARLVEAIKDKELPRLIPSLNCRVRLTVGDQKATLSITNGEVALDADAAQADVTVSASPEAWSKVLQTPPPATYHSFTALQLANQEFEISGLPLEIAKARPALERLFELVIRAPTNSLTLCDGPYRQLRAC